MRDEGRASRNAEAYAAKVKVPFAVLGIRTNGVAVTGVEYLPKDTPVQNPRDAVAARAVAEIKRWLLRHEGYRFGA